MFGITLICFLVAPGLGNALTLREQPTASSADATIDCASALGPLITGMPSAPPEFLSFWGENNPATKSCVAEAPESLRSQFSSVFDEYRLWGAANSDALASITSQCGDFNLGGLIGRNEPATTVPPVPGFSIPAEWQSFAAGFATGLPGGASGFAAGFGGAFGDLPPCPSTSEPCSTETATGPVPTSTGSFGNYTTIPYSPASPSSPFQVSGSNGSGSMFSGVFMVVVVASIAM